jgi:transcriptional regulator with GAF, ATPase, and Fis domain
MESVTTTDSQTATRRKRVRSAVPPLDREQVIRALKLSAGRVGGNDGAAAKLGMKRTMLIALLKRLNIDSRSVMTLS